MCSCTPSPSKALLSTPLMCEIISGRRNTPASTLSSLNYTQRMTGSAGWFISVTPMKLDELQVRKMNQGNLHTQLWGTWYMSSVTTQHSTNSVAPLPQVPNTPLSCTEESSDEVQVRVLSQCLKTLSAPEAIPHSNERQQNVTGLLSCMKLFPDYRLVLPLQTRGRNW